MAKRTPRSSANDSSAPAEAHPAKEPSRAKATRETGNTTTDPRAAQAAAQEPAPEAADTFAARPSQANEFVDIPRFEAGRQASGEEPNDEEIRRRAYQRYLERGGGHGADFEDWLEAERGLKHQRQSSWRACSGR